MSHTDQLSAALAGRYTIEREIGAGGMATVYAARDLKHDRRVALKVLKPELAAVLGVERFLAEIRVTANLQHPNLLPLFDSGEAGDGYDGAPVKPLFYVMPFVEGESLRALLERVKQLPVDQAVRFAVAIAEALDYAHRHGVVHRDLKPENILLHEGQPLVADFGIALAVTKAGGNRITQTGLSLGTPQYMSPEQATGDRDIDGRTDVYSLAAVFYEMLTGDPPHLGGTTQAVISKVLTEKPRSVRASRPAVSAHVDAAVLRALEKIPADRFATAHEFAEALQGRGVVLPFDVVAPAVVSEPPQARRADRARSVLPWALAAAFGVAAVAAWIVVRPQHVGQTFRFVLAIPESQRFEMLNGVPVVLAPDGRAILYGGAGGLQYRRLYYQRLDQLEAQPLPGTDNASTPFFSPDGKTVAFASGPELRSVAVAGGAPTVLASVGFVRSPTWAADSVIYAGTTAGLLRFGPGQRKAESLTQPDSTKGELSHGTPILGPDGKTIIYWVRAAPPIPDHLALLNLDTKTTRDIEGESSNPLGVLDGYLIFGRRDGTLYAVRYDPQKLRSLADAVPVVNGIAWRGAGGIAASLSRDGSLAYVRGGNATQLVVTDESGTKTVATSEARDFTDPSQPPAFSPDGRRVAVSVFESGVADPWLFDVSTSTLTRLTLEKGVAATPAWTPDGKRIAVIDRNQAHDLWWGPADGSRPLEKFVSLPEPGRSLAFSPDGMYAVVCAGQPADLWVVPLAGDHKPELLFHTPFNEIDPAISPDGKWIAYASDISGRLQIFLRPMPGPGNAFQVSAAAVSAQEPQWTRDGRLLFRSDDSLTIATLSKGPEPKILSQRRLFEIHAGYGVSPDGKRFALLRSSTGDYQVVVVVNWITELRAQLAAASTR